MQPLYSIELEQLSQCKLRLDRSIICYIIFNFECFQLITRYRKFNLHNEPNIRQPLHPDNTTFNTDFNVTFGVFICFDILFDAPANHLVKNGIRHFVNPSLWYSELPYLTGKFDSLGTRPSKIKLTAY